MKRAGQFAAIRSEFAVLFVVMLAIAAGNTALQSVLPAVGRTLGIPDSGVAVAFSVSALIWIVSAPFWARRSDHHGRKRMVLVGISGFSLSLFLCGLALTAGTLGWMGPVATMAAFVAGRGLYGVLGSAAPPAAQALVAGATSRDERTRALSLLASAFGLGTILGPALAPFMVLPVIGFAGPAFLYAVLGLFAFAAVLRVLPDDHGTPADHAHGAATAYPSIGGQPSGASVTAAAARRSPVTMKLRDPRIWPWMLIGLVGGHTQVMAGQTMAFLVIDRLGLPPVVAQQSVGIVLMVGAGATLLAQWGLIPMLNLGPRTLVISGCLIAGIGTALISASTSLYALCVTFAIASLGFGFVRPGFTAGASLAVSQREQGATAGQVTAVNGSVFVLGPTIGIGLYEFSRPLPYLVAAAALIVTALYAMRAIHPTGPNLAAPEQ